MTLDETIAREIAKALRDHNGNVDAAARALGVHRRTVQRWRARAAAAASTLDGAGAGS